MNQHKRCLPIGDLPYDTEKTATRMILKLFEKMPFLANLPVASGSDFLAYRTLINTPGITLDNNKIYFNSEENNIKQKLVSMDSAYNNPTLESLHPFRFNSAFLTKFLQITERLKPENVVVNFLGPITLSQRIEVQPIQTQILTDKFYRKFIIQSISIKALWIINKIKEVSPDTKPIIILEEPLLYKAGSIKRENEEVTQDVIVNTLAKVISKIKEAGAIVGVQSLEKCDWKIPIEAGTDIISFDAYNNPNNLNIISDTVNEFLAKGGIINWAIVPAKNESIVKSLTIDNIYDRFIKTVEGLISSGTSEKLTYNRATVSIIGDLSHLPLNFAEKALILTTQLAKKIPIKS